MTTIELAGVLDFLRAAAALKTQTRSGYTSAGRAESVADHTWRLCLMAVVLADQFPGIDFARFIRICVVHDLGEAIGGDVPAVNQSAAAPKSDRERADLLTLLAPLPTAIRDHVTELWDEYEAAATPEAKLAKAFDKLETILQHTQGANPPGFDYRFNLDYGRQYTAAPPLVASIREALDRDTLRRAEGA
ncbi:MAG: HD domain-containing protein [Gemmataceae bacterium]